jgi:hypothetical protein
MCSSGATCLHVGCAVSLNWHYEHPAWRAGLVNSRNRFFLCVFSAWRWEMIVRFGDFGGIGDHYCLKLVQFLYAHTWVTTLETSMFAITLPMLVCKFTCPFSFFIIYMYMYVNLVFHYDAWHDIWYWYDPTTIWLVEESILAVTTFTLLEHLSSPGFFVYVLCSVLLNL